MVVARFGFRNDRRRYRGADMINSGSGISPAALLGALIGRIRSGSGPVDPPIWSEITSPWRNIIRSYDPKNVNGSMTGDSIALVLLVDQRNESSVDVHAMRVAIVGWKISLDCADANVPALFNVDVGIGRPLGTTK